MNIQHSSRTDLWYTPLPIVVAARDVLGPIDLDPASDEFGNARVGAARYLTREMDGLTTPWVGRTVFCNPPGGKKGNKSNTALFWARLMAHREAVELDHAIFLAFSAEALQNTQGKGVPPIMAFPFCVPAQRLAFDSREGPGKDPSHSNVIVYVPGTVDRTETFRAVFAKFGAVR